MDQWMLILVNYSMVIDVKTILEEINQILNNFLHDAASHARV